MTVHSRRNRRAGVRSSRGAGRKGARSLSLSLISMSQEEFSAAFKGSPTKRARLRRLKRNASVVLGNMGSPADVLALVEALADGGTAGPRAPGVGAGEDRLPAAVEREVLGSSAGR